MIYFIQADDGGPIKIGTTENLEVRVESLQRSYRRRLVVLATMPGSRPEERSLHLQFAHLRIGRTEQFRPAPELMAFIGRPLLVDPNPDAVEVMETAEERTRSAVTNIRSTPQWKSWLAKLAEFNRSPSVADLMDDALVAYADAIGFTVPPPKR